MVEKVGWWEQRQLGHIVSIIRTHGVNEKWDQARKLKPNPNYQLLAINFHLLKILHTFQIVPPATIQVLKHIRQ